MVGRIARHEFVDVLRDDRFRVVSAVVFSLLLVSLLTGWTYQRAVSAEHASAARTSHETWLAQSAKDPHSAAHYGAYVFKPRGPLTLVDSGINPYTGVAAWLEAHKQNDFQFRPAQDRASVARLGQVTAAVTLQVLAPILVILLAFTKFAGERENGTLRQVLAAGVRASQLALGKTVGVSAALGLVVVPAAVVGSAALLWSSGAGAMGENAGRLLGLAAAYSVYILTFLGMALAVSAFARKASSALAVLIAFWALNVVLVPRAAADLSRVWYPTPSAFEMHEAVRHDTYDGLPVHDYNVLRAADLRERLLAQYGVARVDDLPVNFRGIDYLEREARSNEVWAAHYEALWRAFEAQAAVHRAAGFAAPLLAVRAISMALTGVDVAHHQHFARAAEDYRRRLVLAMNTDLAYGGSSARRGAYTADPALWSTIDPFVYEAPDAAWALSRVPAAVAAMALWLSLAGIALTVSLRRVAVE